MQTKLGSLVEAVVNIIIGFVINTFAQTVIFPFFGMHLLLSQNIQIALIFTIISLCRSYLLRRFFNKVKKGRFYA